MDKTTVVIPNYNGIHFLKECIESLEGYPIIIVDNGSTDGSVSWIKEHYPQIKLLCNEKNEGFCKACNQGINMVKTPYCFLLNNDTVVEQGCIDYLEKQIEQSERIFSVQAKLLSLKEPERIDDAGDLYCALGWAFALGKGKIKTKYNKTKKIFASCGGAVLYRKEIFEQLGGFDEEHFAYLEDIDLGYRGQIHGYDNYIEPNAIVYHAGSATSGSRYNAFKINLASRNSVYLFLKNMPFLQLIINLPLLLIGILIKLIFFIKKGYGLIYLKGCMHGVSLFFSTNARAHHIKHRMKNSGRYFYIQLQLWWNLVRRVIG